MNRRRWLAGMALGAGATHSWAAIGLAAGARQLSFPFELIDNRLFVRALVNDRGPFQFIFDTGGANILDVSVAHALDLPLGDGFSMPGAGDGQLPAWRTQVAKAEVGGLQMTTLPFVVLPLQDLRRAIGFARLDGLIGHEVLRRFVARLDFIRGMVTLTEPEVPMERSASAVELPISFSGNLPVVAGHIDGRPARLVIDSGDRSSLTLFTPFVDEHQLREAYPKRFHALTGWGVGGPLPADVTQVESLALGALAVPRVTTRMPTGSGGVFATRAAQASVGTGVLRRLDVTFDYCRRLLVLAPNADHGRLDPVDHSGLWLAQGTGEFVVEHVSERSAATDAGLQVGDRVLAVDGQTAGSLSLPHLRERWAIAGPGLVALLTVKSGDAAALRVARLVLRDRFKRAA